ncbi:hypothetical protein MRX96_034561 [Rhipicephalus microplus]
MTDDPFKCLLGEISEDQWQAYKALRKHQGGLVEDDDSPLDSASSDVDTPQDASAEKTDTQDAEKLRSLLTTKYINGEITFAEFTDRMDLSLTPKEENLKEAEQELDDDFLRPSHRKNRARRLPRDLQGLVGAGQPLLCPGQLPGRSENVHGALGEPQRALQFSLIGAYLSPQDADEWSRLGELSLEQGDVHQAIACYVQAVRADPSNMELRFELCSLYEQVGNQQRALACCTALVQQMGHGDACLKLSRELAKVHHQRGNVAVATQVLLSAVKKFPTHVSSEDINMLLELQLAQKMFQAALMVLHSYCGVKLLPLPEDCKELTGELLTDSLATFERCEVPAEMPVDLRTKLILCLVYLGGGEQLTGGLLDQLQRDEDPEDAGDLFLDVAEALMEVRRVQEARPLLHALVNTRNYGMAAVWLRYGECLQQLGCLREATSAYERTCELAPSHSQARLALCQLLLAQGLTERAIACLESADAPRARSDGRRRSAAGCSMCAASTSTAVAAVGTAWRLHRDCQAASRSTLPTHTDPPTSTQMLEETSYRYQPLQAAALRLSARAAAGARVTSANSYNHCEGDPVPEAEQGAVRDPEDILDPRAILTHGCLPSAMVCSKEIITRPGHPRSRAPNHR